MAPGIMEGMDPQERRIGAIEMVDLGKGFNHQWKGIQEEEIPREGRAQGKGVFLDEINVIFRNSIHELVIAVESPMIPDHVDLERIILRLMFNFCARIWSCKAIAGCAHAIVMINKMRFLSFFKPIKPSVEI